MKKAPKIASFLLLALIILGSGYFIGHRVGRMYGAQQYTKKLWATDEIQLSSRKIMEKINNYRSGNGLPPFEETIGLCRLANFRAKEALEKFGGKWNTATQSYEGAESPDALHETDLTEEDARKLCPECRVETLQENVYISLRPESCINLSDREVCSGEEKFGVVEDYTDRAVNGWIDSPTHNEVLLSLSRFGCVDSYGGVVILQAGDANTE